MPALIIMADWLRGEVIRRLSSEGRRCGLGRFTLAHGKAYRMLTGDPLGRARMRAPSSLLPRPLVFASLTALCRGWCMEMASLSDRIVF